MNLPVTITELEAFLAVAELESFSRAADKLCITQPAVTSRVARLEKALGYRLIDRTTRNQSLTTDGKRVKLIAERALSEIGLLFHAGNPTRRRPAEIVNVVCTSGINSIFLPAMVHVFNQQHPDILVRISDRSPTTVIEAVQSRRANLGIMAPGLGASDISFTPLVEDECVVVARADHPLSAGASVSFAETLSHPVLMAEDQLPLRRTVQALADAHGLVFERAPEGRYPGSIQNLFSMVASGYGIMLQPGSLVRFHADLPLRAIPIRDVCIPHIYGLIQSNAGTPDRATELFRNFLVTAAANKTA